MDVTFCKTIHHGNWHLRSYNSIYLQIIQLDICKYTRHEPNNGFSRWSFFSCRMLIFGQVTRLHRGWTSLGDICLQIIYSNYLAENFQNRCSSLCFFQEVLVKRLPLKIILQEAVLAISKEKLSTNKTHSKLQKTAIITRCKQVFFWGIKFQSIQTHICFQRREYPPTFLFNFNQEHKIKTGLEQAKKTFFITLYFMRCQLCLSRRSPFSY